VADYPVELPGGSQGQHDVPFSTAIKGVKVGGTARASGEVTTATNTSLALTFDLDTAFASGGLAGYIPLFLHVEIYDTSAAANVIGRWNTNMQGDSSADTNYARISTTGADIPVYDIAVQGKTVYVRTEAATGGDGVLIYWFILGRRPS
jgi:hypothetical protein